MQFSYRVKIKGVVCGDVCGEFGWGLIELSLLFKFILVRNVDEFCRLRVRHQGAALARPNPRDNAPCLLSSLRRADLPMTDPYHILQLLTFYPLPYSYNREHDHLFWNDISFHHRRYLETWITCTLTIASRHHDKITTVHVHLYMHYVSFYLWAYESHQVKAKLWLRVETLHACLVSIFIQINQ